jgi:hypothetical protein
MPKCSSSCQRKSRFFFPTGFCAFFQFV